MKIGKMVTILYQWIVVWIALYWFIQGYMYVLRNFNNI